MLEDMRMQERWVHLMRPRAAMLKFCLPYNADKQPAVDYLDGQIYLPVWGPRTTSESRLFVTDPTSTRTYDTRDYDNAMWHFNVLTRVSLYPHSSCHDHASHRAMGYDCCYDCTAERFVLRGYLRRLEGIRDERLLDEGAARLAELLSAYTSRLRKSVNSMEWLSPDQVEERRAMGS